MLVGLKSVMISWTTGLYGLKFAKLSASVGDFSYLISYNWSVLLQLSPFQSVEGDSRPSVQRRDCCGSVGSDRGHVCIPIACLCH
jgi:hypothetical protein